MTELVSGRAKARAWLDVLTAVLPIVLLVVVFARAAPQFKVDFRSTGLVQTMDGLRASGAPLVRELADGTLVGAAPGDDQGLYLAAPYLAQWSGIDVVEAGRLVMLAIVILGGIVGLAGALKLSRSPISRVYAGIVFALLAWYTLVYVISIYAVQFAIPAAFVPWLAVAFIRREEPAAWSEWLMLCLGIMGAFVNLMRGNAATGVFIGAVVLVAFSRARVVRRLRLVGALVLGVALVALAMSGVYAARDGYLVDHGRPTSDLLGTHVFWHSVYIGLGYTDNPFVAEYADAVANAKVAQVHPGPPPSASEREAILRNAVFDLVREQPGFVLRQLGAKAWVMLTYLLLLPGVRPLYNLGLLGLVSGRVGFPIWLAFACMLAFYALVGLLVIPIYAYVLGYSTVAAMFGVVSTALAVGDEGPQAAG